jgi:hypothetical protein
VKPAVFTWKFGGRGIAQVLDLREVLSWSAGSDSTVVEGELFWLAGRGGNGIGEAFGAGACPRLTSEFS